MSVIAASGELFDEVDRHLGEARSFERAALPLGMYLAWCANHQLLSDDLSERAAELVLRVRFREITGTELAVAGCAGALAAEHLNAEGQAFTAAYYPRYMTDFRTVFGPDPYAVRDDWEHYDQIAPHLTRALMRFRGRSAHGGRKRERPRPSWWKFWA